MLCMKRQNQPRQGYKVFKELKDLRNEKKNKSRELEALRSLTYGIDCKYMSENLAYSIQEMEQICNATKQGVSDMELDIKDEEIEQPDSLLEVLAG